MFYAWNASKISIQKYCKESFYMEMTLKIASYIRIELSRNLTPSESKVIWSYDPLVLHILISVWQMRKAELQGLNTLPKLTQPESRWAETEPCFAWVSWQRPFSPIIWWRGDRGAWSGSSPSAWSPWKSSAVAGKAEAVTPQTRLGSMGARIHSPCPHLRQLGLLW